MRITLLPVYSKLADPADAPVEVARRLPADWRLSQHQVETYQALTARDVDVVVNTAMTGDGKSLAAYLPALVDVERHAFGMYPTIELSRDQQRQFQEYAAKWGRSVRYDALWGARLGELAREHSVKRRGEMLKERFDSHQVLLTNPDIFNLVMSYRYGSALYTEQELPYSLAINFDDLIFDEFHIFSMPQIVAAVTAMLYLVESRPGRAPRFLFSSATPDPTLLQMLRRAGLTFREIGGEYRSAAGDRWRHVLHRTELTLRQLDENESAEQWLRTNAGLIVDHWQRSGRQAKAAIILNSVASARRAARLLGDLLKPHDISVGEVTGLTDDARRRAAMEKADVIVGTSTIDVGVDFNISLLIYEALDAGTFLQRLGRLGRVRRSEAAFAHYEAHALFSGRTPWLHERLVQALQTRGVREGDAVDRPATLREAVVEAFPTATAFKPYARRWGILQAAHVVAALEHYRREGAYTSLADALRQRYAKLFDVADFDQPTRRYWALAGKKQARPEKQQNQAILDEVLAFRGSSPFQAAVWDTTIQPPAFIDYDALSLVQNAVYTVVDEQEYLAALGQQSPEAQSAAREELRWAIKGKNEAPLVLKILQFLEEREGLVLDWEGDLRNFTQQVYVLKGCIVSEPRRSHDLATLNQFLRRQLLVCYFTTRELGEVRRKLKLPPHFPLYRVEQRQFNRQYTAAFGKAALLLEAEMIRLRGRDETTEAIIC